MLRTAAALSSPPTESPVGAGASTTGSDGGRIGGGDGGGSGAGAGSGSALGAGSGSALGAGGGSGASSALLLRAYCFGGAAGWAAVSPAGMDMSSRVSMRSTRCSNADSVSLADGNSSRAHTTSSSSRGAVAPRISPSPACTTSAYLVRVAVPIRVDWSRIRSNTSSGPSTTPRAVASGTDCSTIRSRKRSSRSVANRRGSCPASITASTAPNSAAASPAASASTASSISATSVAPSKASARWYSTRLPSAPASSWSNTDSVSRGEPPPARMTNGYTASSTDTSSEAQMRSSNDRMVRGANSRNG